MIFTDQSSALRLQLESCGLSPCREFGCDRLEQVSIRIPTSYKSETRWCHDSKNRNAPKSIGSEASLRFYFVLLARTGNNERVAREL